MAFDSLAALTLFASAVAAWWLSRGARARARFPLRFAAVLFAAFAVSFALGLLGFPDLMAVVAMMAVSLGGAALAMALFAVLGRPLPPVTAALGLMLALFAALATPLAGSPLYALGSVGIAAVLVAGMSFSRFSIAPGQSLLAMGAMLAVASGGFAVLAGAWIASLLLFSAALIGAGRASVLGVEARQQREALATVGAQ